ncbi:MAG: UDP-N-acetylmuramoyl-L-alanyl-D-glutamate--2,6-diaminopimelate ligase [Deltaproteobacteria bacterium]|nr:UDP-N-acetylmuramoyl-L-alanyl-D-glutamate--2,6-diaminopimelate ligase [Deltaproteobacteria bacterium]
MRLDELFGGTETNGVTGSMASDISGIAYHTRQVQPGFIFVAIRGTAADGHDFVSEAIAAGAIAVASARQVAVPSNVTNVVVADTRRALATLAARWYGEPSRTLRLVGVTGTNGKSTITYLLEAIWQAAARSPGVVGTINVRYGGKTDPAPTTTPESLDLQALLRAMLAGGVQDVVMEVSSHALDQERVTGCHFDGAIFTNLTQDHLDYHGDMASYAAAKRRLFTEQLPVSCKPRPWAVINVDDQASESMVAETHADCVVEECRCTLDGIQLQIATPMGRYGVTSSLCGRFNAGNILAAATAAFAMGLSVPAIQRGIQSVAVVPGRCERVTNTAGIHVLVDYAHTPDALCNVLRAVRELGPKRIVTVFGCGGDRDPGKRPLMGTAVARGSDLAIVTSDNPRMEDPLEIIRQILPGLTSEGWQETAGKGRNSYAVIPDRRAAIHAALRAACSGDCVLVAGKGHEDYQIVGREKRHFDDREVVREYFADGPRGG